MAGPSINRPTFYFDLGSPYAYLAAERVNALFAAELGEPPEWQPVLLGGLFKRFGRDSWANGPGRADGLAEIERRAADRGLPPVRWPEPFPGNTLYAMRVAAYAKEIGRVVAFSLAAFRQAFAGGRDLTEPDNVLLAAAASEMHPRAVTAAVERESVKGALREATERAGDLGVQGVPTIVVADEAYWGDDQLERAVEAARS
jgi:2-hydroxychromene-2-carboxylate isomerase